MIERYAHLLSATAEEIGFAGCTEALTSVLIAINQHYKVKAAGLRITGLPER